MRTQATSHLADQQVLVEGMLYVGQLHQQRVLCFGGQRDVNLSFDTPQHHKREQLASLPQPLWVADPPQQIKAFFKLFCCAGGEDVWQQEVQQRPQLCACMRVYTDSGVACTGD